MKAIKKEEKIEAFMNNYNMIMLIHLQIKFKIF